MTSRMQSKFTVPMATQMGRITWGEWIGRSVSLQYQVDHVSLAYRWWKIHQDNDQPSQAARERERERERQTERQRERGTERERERERRGRERERGRKGEAIKLANIFGIKIAGVPKACKTFQRPSKTSIADQCSSWKAKISIERLVVQVNSIGNH